MSKKYIDILIEKELEKLKYNNPVPVRLSFDGIYPSIGLATLETRDDGIYASFEVNTVVTGLYPSIGFEYEK